MEEFINDVPFKELLNLVLPSGLNQVTLKICNETYFEEYDKAHYGRVIEYIYKEYKRLAYDNIKYINYVCEEINNYLQTPRYRKKKKEEKDVYKEKIQYFISELKKKFSINQGSQPPPSGGGKNVKSIIVYKTKGGHYYRKYKNGNKKRISFEKYKKLK